MPQSPDIGQNSDGVISDFQVSGESLIKQNFDKSRTSDDIDMKLGLVTKFDKRNKKPSKKIENNVMPQILTSWSFIQFMDNLEESGDRISDPHIVCET